MRSPRFRHLWFNGSMQWFPTFLISRPYSKILHTRSTPGTIYNSKDARITTVKIRNTIFSRVGFTVFTFICKRKQHVRYNQGTTELTSVKLALRRLGVCWWELISCHSQRPVCSLTFVLICTRVENPASKIGVDIRISRFEANSQKGAPNSCWGARFGAFAQMLIAA